MSPSDPPLRFEIDAELSGARLDKALATLLPAHSRAAVQRWIKQNQVRVDGEPVAQKHRLALGECIEVCIPETEPADWRAQQMPLDIVHADDELLVINKPPGLVVHPGAGRADSTLLNGLLHHDDALRKVARAGIVHRLDKDTSGLLVIARTEAARLNLIEQLSARTMHRSYIAVVHGTPIAGMRIDQPIGRHHRDRLRMCVTHNGKPAATRISIIQKFRAHSVLRAELESGRTHQIRVHLQYAGYPIVGDKLYGGRMRQVRGAGDALRDALQQFNRQALHAEHLALVHPRDNKLCKWHCEPPADLQNLIAQLQADDGRG